jgi:hypothetical protein
MARVLLVEMVMGEEGEEVYIVHTCQLPTLTLDITLVLLQMARVLLVEMVMGEEGEEVYIVYTYQLLPTLTLDTIVALL